MNSDAFAPDFTRKALHTRKQQVSSRLRVCCLTGRGRIKVQILNALTVKEKNITEGVREEQIKGEKIDELHPDLY